MAKQYGADHVVNGREQDAVAAVRDLTRNGEGADKSIECTANTAVREQAIQAIRGWGTACMVGVFGKIEFDSNELIHLHKTVVGSLTFSKNLQEECALFVAERGLDVESLFTNEFQLDDAERAYELFDQRKIGKGVFIFA
jgi:threonine dehydrogenase-like Zn-dependent dehydrogenase